MGAPLKPAEILEVAIDTGTRRASYSFSKLAVLGILAGAMIAFAAEGSTMAAFNLLADPNTYGLGRAVAGVVFPTGLMLVVLTGCELFTGNTLMVTSLLEKRITMGKMLKNWVIVYGFNLIGSVLIALLMANSGLFHAGGDMAGAITVKIAAGKTSLDFLAAFFLGIMCNWLVCLAVWLSYGADTLLGKMMGIFFPISLFITSGFEHSVANMYYIPAGILAKANGAFADLSGVSPDGLAGLTWGGFFVNNLIPVTLGNLVGGAIFVGMAYWYSGKRA
ncbi:MAG: formate/nitrite transporter family protein [Anaerovoracaceae bacterium]|jgi:formate/nitrite transporter